MSKSRRGNCYVTCEALYHLLGGSASEWRPCYVKHEGETHWFLRKPDRRYNVFNDKILSWDVTILDPTVKQFKTTPDYSKGKGCGFLTKKPSKRAKKLMKMMLWQEAQK